MLVVQNVSKEFGGRVLFSDVNLRLDPNKVYGIVGANGSGKSTLLRIMTGNACDRRRGHHSETTPCRSIGARPL